ncbi:MAG: carboxypeptidase-like regulatory domain-containing protein, partial [Candidatus Sericytochromatia bacterium]|nr:carboxypeptidase-like regulatory domain-containing protein [Candidatus Sericytochromatia bacterium]
PAAAARPSLVTVQGVVRVPARLLAEAGGALIGKVRIYRLAQEAALRPLPGADVHLADARGEALPGLPRVRTDAAGRFELPGVPDGLTYQVIAHAPTTSGGRATLRGLAKPGAGEIAVGLGTTMVATALLDPSQGLGQLDQGALQALADRVEAELPASRTPDLARDEAVAASVEAMLAEDAGLRMEVETLKRRLAENGLSPEAQRARVREALPGAPTGG